MPIQLKDFLKITRVIGIKAEMKLLFEFFFTLSENWKYGLSVLEHMYYILTYQLY